MVQINTINDEIFTRSKGDRISINVQKFKYYSFCNWAPEKKMSTGFLICATKIADSLVNNISSEEKRVGKTLWKDIVANFPSYKEKMR